MDEERKRKIEAGKSQWAKFKSRKNRSTKSSSPPDAILSRVHEKSCPVDPGGVLDKTKELHSPENSTAQDSSLSNSRVTFESTIHPDKVSSDESGNSVSDKIIPVMESSSQHDTSDSQPDLLANISETLPKNQLRLESSSSLDSFTEGTIDESESSSGSDNSTITGISTNSSSDSATEKDFPEPLPPVVPDNVPELESYVVDPDKTDNRPDEEKACTNVITKEQVVENSDIKRISEFKENISEKLLSVPVEEVPLETCTEMRSHIFNVGDQSKNTSVMDASVKDKSAVISEDVNITLQKLLSLTEADDEPIPLLNADDTELVSLFDKKIKKYQEAILQRDSIISKLSDRLETAMKANQAVNSAGNSQAETLRDEINLLQLKMKETAELLKKQKLKNGNLEFESCACQTDGVEICKCDTAVQVETSISSLLQTCDLDDISFIELLKNKYFIDSELLPQNVQKLKELFLSHLPHVHIQEFVRSLKSDINTQKSEAVLEETNNASGDNELQCSEKVDSATILKKINSLNMVAKLIESLLSISSGSANDTFSDFSPSKFQSFFLRRLHSSETGDGLQDVSENESLLSDINYAEVETPCSKPNINSALSLEKLRRKNISEDFSLVTEFLQDEMDKLCSFIPSFSAFQRDAESQDGLDCASETFETGVESEHQKILLHKSKLETRLKNLKSFDKELHDVQLFPHQLSIDSDTMTMSEDNLMKEEFPSCISLVSSIVSLTDSEYKTDNIMTDSETNYSRKVSVDMTRSMQEREFCIRCERNMDLLKEKYENEMLCIKESLEKSYNSQKNEFLENIKSLESEINHLKTEKEKLDLDLKKQIELLHNENANKLKLLSEEHQKELIELKSSRNKSDLDKIELETKLKELEEKLTYSNQRVRETLDEKANIEITLQMQIADLIGEHQQDMETMKLDYETKLNIEKKHFENNYKSSIEVLKKVHEEEINDLKCQIKQEFEEREKNLLNEHSKTISMIEAAHCDESAVYQKKIEQLLEEKCELLTKTTQEYETILKKNHRALVILCKQLLTKINAEKEKVINESIRSSDFDTSFAVFDQLNRSLENGLVKFLNQNYFMNSNSEEFSPDETEYLPIELNDPVGEEDMPLKIEMKDFVNSTRKEETLENKNQESPGELGITPSESSLDSDDMYTIHTEINKLQEEFQKDVAFYKDVNDQLHLEIKTLRKQNQDLEEQKENLTSQLQEKVKELAAKESMLAAVDAASVKGGSPLSATDIRSWQVQAAQTNSRLLHVLSDLVKTFLDIEQDINAHLLEYGLIPTRTLAQHDDDTGQSIGSREDFTSLSLGECPNLELTEDGPDLTPRAWDVFITAGNYDTELEGEDVVLGASRRLRLAVDHVLNLLSRALENQQSQDLKLLLKRNEELSHELQEESQGRDAVHMELVTAESTLRKLESEKQRLEDLNRNLKEDYELLKRELSVERSKVSHLQQEKESAFDEIHTLKEQCGLLASRLGDPEKTENDKMLNSSGTCLHENSELLQENSRLSSEKHTVQKNLSKERQSFMDRLQQMELALEELNAEKDDVVEKKCKEIRDLKAEMEGMDKQLQSNRKFIEQQALEREQEREEFIKEITKMQDFVREKEKIQSTEAQMTREIESLEQLLQARIDDHRNAMAKKDEVEKELRHSLDKIRDLREVIEELEKQLDLKNRVEVGLRQKLASVCESMPNQDKNSSLSDSGDSSKNAHLNGESIEQLHSLKEQLASQSQEIEMMSQSQTLLHELRGQIHFLEAKVEQRARQLENSFLSAASSPVQSGATSPSGSQDSESLQIPCEDGWEMSPRSIHWLEVRRLEEKIGRLAHIDEELLKKNKELELQLKKLKASYTESQHENTVLQDKLSEQLMQISALKSHIDEQKHRCATPQRSHSFADKIEELQEQLEKQIENNKRLISDLEEAQATVSAVQDEIQKKNEIIAILQKCVDKPNISEDESSDISAIEDLKLQLSDKIKLINRTEKENEQLKSKNEYLRTENTSLKSLLEKAEKEGESERIRVENLCEEMANLTENSKEGAISVNKSNCNDTNESPISEETQDCSANLKTLESRLKEKNLENLMLKATITKLESSLRTREQQLELEKVLVETLQQELGSLIGYQKRLEQDFNTVQDMMQQKERELATLHEETEAQMKLEAEIETLVQKLSDQKNLELQLREEVKELESQLDVYKSLKEEIEKKDLFIKNLKESHKKELVNLNKQIAVLKNFSTVKGKEFDVDEFVKRIMEATDAFKNENGNESLHEVLIKLVQTSVGNIVKQLKQKYEDRVTSINVSWQEKINQEIEQKQSYKSAAERLQKTFQSEKEKLSAEKDLFWQEKIKDVELKLKNEEMKYENLCDSAKVTRNELQTMFTAQINSLRQNLECALKEKNSLESIIRDLQNEVERLKQAENDQRIIFSSEYEAKLSAICKTIKESFEKEKQNVIMACQHKIDQLQKELDFKLEQSKNAELKHKEELSSIHKYFEARWANEMKKVKDFQSEDLKKLKDSNDRILEDKLRKAKEEFSHLISEERKQVLMKHKCELEQQQEKFEQEKKLLLQMKEKAVKDATEILEKKFNENLAEIQKSLASSNQLKSSEGHSTREWEEEKLKLISSHRKEMSALKQEMKNRYEKQLQAQSAVHNAEMKRLEESYNMKVEEVHDLIREAKRAASKTGYSDTGSNRTTTPSSDMTSSDEACSSCQEDMLSINKHILVDKIHQDGKRVLSLIESTAAPFSSVKEAHLWLEERKWIVNKLKTITPVTSNASLKIIISNLVDEIQKFRMNFETALEENAELKQKHDDLEQELSIQYSKFCDVTVELKNQKAAYSELESLLSIKTSELAEVKKKLAEASRLAQISAEKEAFSLDNRSTGSPSYEIGLPRSADEPRSAEKFSMFLPDIDNTPSLEQKTPSNKFSQVPEISLPRIDVSTLISVQTASPPDAMNATENDVTKVKEKLMAVLNKGIDTTDAKLHGLYWVYRRSQSYNKALIYQKKYLLMLLRGFQVTEKATLAWLKHIDKNTDTGNPSSPASDSTVTDSPLSPRSRFRSAVFVMIALQRLKFYVKRWRLLAKIPSSQVINVEIQSVFQNYSFLSPSISPGVYHLSSHSLASVPTSLAGRDYKSSQMSTSSRAENKSKNSTNPDKSQLIEYVHRLEILQKQLGLDSLR